MNHTRILLVTIIMTMLFYSLAGQVAVDSRESNWISYTNIKMITKKVLDEQRFQGDLYLFKEWKSAYFDLPDGSKTLIDSVKLNLLRNAVEILVDGEHLEIENREFDSFQWVDDPNSEFKYRHYYYYKGQRLPGIIKVIELDDYGVLVAYHTAIREVSKENPLMIDKLRKDYVRVTKQRFIESGGELFRVKSKKDLVDYFKSDKNIKKYISKNKLSHKKEDDIANIIAYYASNN